MEGVWFTEKQTPTVAISYLTKNVLFAKRTPYQEVKVIDTVALGRALILDDVIQTTVGDEFVYHEMITLVPLNTHPQPRHVLIIGGGDGGSMREAVSHPKVEKATLVEIDAEVIEAAKKYLPETASAFEDPKAEVIIGDGITYMEKVKSAYDVIIVDAPDPVGPAEGLFSASFYRNVYEALKEDGIFVVQSESPFYNQDLLKRIYRDVKEIFPIAKVYLACIPSYPGGLWSFTLGSKVYDPEKADLAGFTLRKRYYNPRVHQAAFFLPNFVAEILEEAGKDAP